jgi:predicted Zn-dependent peptidase
MRDRLTKAPAAPEPQGVTQVQQFSIGQVEVVHKQRTGQVMVAEMIFQGGKRNYGAQQAGLELLTLRTLAASAPQGTAVDSFHARLEQLGAELEPHVGPDYASLRLVALPAHFPEAWNAFVNLLRRPALDSSAFAQALRSLQAERRQTPPPALRLTQLADSAFFKGHPYQVALGGDSASLAALSFPAVQAHYDQLLDRWRMRLVITGPLKGEKVARLVFDRLKDLPDGTGAPPMPPIQPPSYQPIQVDTALELPQLQARFRAPGLNAGNGPAFVLALEMLRERLYRELCSQRQLSCDFELRYRPQAAAYGRLRLRSQVPGQALQYTEKIIAEARRAGFSAAELAEARQAYLHEHYYNQAGALRLSRQLAAHFARNQLGAYLNLEQRLLKVTPASAQKALQQGFNGLRWYYAGAPGDIGGYGPFPQAAPSDTTTTQPSGSPSPK